MLKRRVLVVALSALAPMAHACNQTTSFGPNDPVVSQLMAEGAIHVAAPGDNVGVYAWNGELGAHVLRASWFDFSLVFTPIEIQPGDEVVYLPEAGGVPGGVELQGCADDPKTLDSVEVTTSLPGRGFLRLVGRGGGGPVSVFRPTVGLEYIEIQPQTLDCQSAREDRYGAVLEAIRGGDSTGFDVAGVFLVQYSPGHRQWWTCPNMQISTCGLLEGSACDSSPPRPGQ